MNLILQTDSYKASHHKQYPPKTQFVHSYFESRGGDYEKVVFFGLQYFIKKYLLGEIVTKYQIEQAESFFKQHFGREDVFNKDGWEHILYNHGGKLPIKIHSLLEGSVVEQRKPLFTVENTCPDCFWLTSYLETLLEQVWYPTTVASRSYHMKQIIKKYLDKTGHDAPDFKLHDFGYRGSTSQESAGLGGASHLLNFMGTDTLAGIIMLQQYYEAEMPGFSIPATEHSTITSWGEKHELDAFSNMLTQWPNGLVAVVSDSFDIFRACEQYWGKMLKDIVLGRDGAVIIRPDSGDPVKVLLRVFKILGKAFNWQKNDKGYYVLPPQIRIIQGDGINEESLEEILYQLEQHEISADNIAFGSGGGLLQDMTRDTLKFAYKTSHIVVDDYDRNVWKNPVTDPGKQSKTGRQNEGMRLVFKNGKLIEEQTLAEIKSRIEAQS